MKNFNSTVAYLTMTAHLTDALDTSVVPSPVPQETIQHFQLIAEFERLTLDIKENTAKTDQNVNDLFGHLNLEEEGTSTKHKSNSDLEQGRAVKRPRYDQTIKNIGNPDPNRDMESNAVYKAAHMKEYLNYESILNAGHSDLLISEIRDRFIQNLAFLYQMIVNGDDSVVLTPASADEFVFGTLKKGQTDREHYPYLPNDNLGPFFTGDSSASYYPFPNVEGAIDERVRSGPMVSYVLKFFVLEDKFSEGASIKASVPDNVLAFLSDHHYKFDVRSKVGNYIEDAKRARLELTFFLFFKDKATAEGVSSRLNLNLEYKMVYTLNNKKHYRWTSL